MVPQTKQFTATVGGRSVIFETGKLAGQAGGAVTVRLGDSVVFAAATMGSKPREGQDFFPLTVEYEERMYAGGRIPGSFFRREGRPSEASILTARLTDRPLRPLFNQDIRNEVQVIMFSLSADLENPLDILAINAASAAVMISDIPWDGPVGAVRVGRADGNFIVNPTYAQMETSDLDLRMAGTKDAILMVECGSDEIPEDVMVQALLFGHEQIRILVDAQLEMTAAVGKAKRVVPIFSIDQALVEKVFAAKAGEIEAIMDRPHTKAEMYGQIDELNAATVASSVPIKVHRLGRSRRNNTANGIAINGAVEVRTAVRPAPTIWIDRTKSKLPRPVPTKLATTIASHERRSSSRRSRARSPLGPSTPRFIPCQKLAPTK